MKRFVLVSNDKQTCNNNQQHIGNIIMSVTPVEQIK